MSSSTDLVLDPALDERVRTYAGISGDVLLLGPTGSGKSEIARRIHELSANRRGPFIPQSCASLPETLADRELFGHVRGAFTTADRDSPGVVKAADGGTLFLDEIGELPLAVQAKLLTLLQTRSYRPLGSVKEQTSSFRLITATNRDLYDLCARKLFREDLHSRINVHALELPALRDSPGLARRIAEKRLPDLALPPGHAARALAAIDRLSALPDAWPANVRDLVTFLQRCVLDVDEQERTTLEQWERRRRAEASAGGPSSLVPIASSRGPSVADRERYAGLLRDAVGHGARRSKAVASPQVALTLASRLLAAQPGALSLDEIAVILDVRDARTIASNLEPLEARGLVVNTGDGLVAVWPPASSTLFTRRDGGWIPEAQGAIARAVDDDEVRIRVTSKCAAVLAVAIVTHGPGGASKPKYLCEGRAIDPSKPADFHVRFDRSAGLEQILLHVGPPPTRGAELVEPLVADAAVPDSAALERGRRAMLDRLHEGWIAEHLVSHARRP